jgi:KUP system potassium uptake protein
VISLITLGAVFLAVTGARSALCRPWPFRPQPIQTAWVGLVLPALALNYLGQGALLPADPKALENPFFHSDPNGRCCRWSRWRPPRL